METGYDKCEYNGGWSEPNSSAAECGWPPGNEGYKADCCCCYLESHIHDMNNLFPEGPVEIEYMPGLYKGCTSKMNVYYSKDGVSWVKFYDTTVTQPTWSPKTTFTETITVPNDFQYIKINIPSCHVDYSSARVLNYTTTTSTTSTTLKPDSCTDTDGNDVQVKGKVYGYENGVYYKHWDFCNFTNVIEYYCDGDSHSFYTFDCSVNFTECHDGACIKEDSDLVAYWKFDEGDGSKFYDSSSYGNDGIVNGQEWTTGKYGSALSFNGKSGYGKVHNSESLNFHETNEFTIDFWFKREGSLINKNEALLSKGTSVYDRGYNIAIKTSGEISFSIRDGTETQGLVSEEVVNDTSWHHLVAKWDGTTMYLYLDEELDNSLYIGSFRIADDSKVLELGNHWGYTDNYHPFHGIIDEVKIYNSAHPSQTTEDTTCSDSDGGVNYYEKGTATSGSTSLSDHCNPDGTLTEKYCSGDEVKWHSYDCPGGCLNGACIKLEEIETEEEIPVEAHICTEEEKQAEVCTMEYNPVCGYSNGGWETYGNACGACVSGAEYWVEGNCKDEGQWEEKEQYEEQEKTQACKGCVYSSADTKSITCLDYGTRIESDQKPKYCDIDGHFLEQKANGESCQNNYECVSNFCSSGECYDIKGEIQETQGLLQTIMDFFKSMFSFD